MRRTQTGLSLIELMVASAIGMLLLLAMTNVVINSSRAHKEIASLGQQLENSRYAMQVLTDEIKHAGFYGQLFGAIPPYTGANLPDPCQTDPALLLDHLELAVQGYDAPAASTGISCLDAADHLDGTDILVIRRAETRLTDLADLSAGDVYLQALPADRIIATGNDASVFTLIQPNGGAPADVRKYRVDIYYVSPCSVPAGSGSCDADADGGNPIPTLKRLVLSQTGGVTKMISEPLVEGIEDLQIDWGIDRNGDGAPNETDAGVTGDDYVAIPPTINEWKNVVALRLHILARNIQASPGYTDKKTYSFGESGTYSPDDKNFKRHLYSGAVRLLNVSSRREGS